MEELLIGLETIARTLGTGIKTLRLWIREYAFPAKRYSDGIYRVRKTSMLEWIGQYESGMIHKKR